MATKSIMESMLAASAERERLDKERNARIDAKVRDVRTLSLDEQQDFLLRFLKALEGGVGGVHAPSALSLSPLKVPELPRPERPATRAAKQEVANATQSRRGTPDPSGTRFVDKAWKHIRDNPGGVRAVDLAAAIKQPTENVSGTLRHVESHGLIVQRGKLWFPVDGDEKPVTLGAAILEILADGTPRGTSAIVHAVTRAHPDMNEKSVASEVGRLKSDGKIVEARGTSGRGALYTLPATGGGSAVAS